MLIRILTAGKQGAPLRPVTGENDMGEKEVLFPPGAVFVVASVDETKVGEVKYHITLKEKGAVEKYAIPEFRRK